MGAFDAELSRIGYRSYSSQGSEPPIPDELLHRREAVQQMHVARMPCPGSCGKVCPNHHCPAHNGEAYSWADSFASRNGFTMREKQEWLAGRFTVEDKRKKRKKFLYGK